MAIEIGSETADIKTLDRTWRTQIESKHGEDPWVEGFRERIRSVNGEVIGRNQNHAKVSRTLSAAIANGDEVTVNVDGKNVTFTALEMAMAIPAFIDLWAGQDEAAAKAAAEMIKEREGSLT